MQTGKVTCCSIDLEFLCCQLQQISTLCTKTGPCKVHSHCQNASMVEVSKRPTGQCDTLSPVSTGSQGTDTILNKQKVKERSQLKGLELKIHRIFIQKRNLKPKQTIYNGNRKHQLVILILSLATQRRKIGVGREESLSFRNSRQKMEAIFLCLSKQYANTFLFCELSGSRNYSLFLYLFPIRNQHSYL